jgi:two-component system NarL family sensor kinase
MAVGALGAALFGAIAAMSGLPVELLDVSNHPAAGWARPAIDFATAGTVTAGAAAVIALAGVAVASRRARGDEWYQLQWLLLGGAVAVAPTLIDLVIANAELPQVVRSLTFLAIPASMVLAMAHHHLYDVDLVVSRTVTGVAIVAAIAIVYVGVVWALAALLGEEALRGPAVVAAVVVAVTLAPLARVARRAVRRVTGRSSDARPLVARLGAQLEQTAADDDLLAELAASVATELRLQRVTIVLDGAGTDCDDGSGDAVPGDEGSMTIPLVHRGTRIGTMTLIPRRGERLGRWERRTAAELSRLVAVAALAIRLGDELEASKRDLERSHDDERRRVRRDLHDGLGPTLASLRLKLGLLQRQVDPPAASALEQLKADVSDAVREVRRIVDGLQPSTVEDLGFVPAVRLLVDDVNRAGSGAGPAIVLTADDDVDELPAALAGAAYRVVGEALANVVRHSRARRCEVSIRRNGALDLRISDDGVGFDPELVAGTGLRSIRTRVEELGGQTEVTARPGAGTTLVVKLPWS